MNLLQRHTLGLRKVDVEHNGPDNSDQREGKKRDRLPEIVGQAEEGGRHCEIGKGLLLKLEPN